MIAWTRKRRSVPYIAQLEAVECGAACLAMVLACHNHHAPLPEVREACGVSRDGVNALAILRAAERYGLKSTAYTTSVSQLAQLPTPSILHWQFNHFVVLEHLHDDGRASIVDPARGRYTVTRELFETSFTGAVLTFSATPSLRPRARLRPNLARYRQWLRANARLMLSVLAMSLVMELLALAIPIGQQQVIDRAIGSQDVSLLWVLAAAVCVATLVRNVLVLVRGYVLGNLQVQLDISLLSNFMRCAVRLPVGFFLQRAPGDLHQRLESNGVLRAFLGTQIMASLLDIFLLVSYAVLMMMYHSGLALIVLGAGLLRAVIQLGQRELHRRATTAELAALGSSGAELVSSLEAIETLRATSAESFALRRWSDAVVRSARASLPRLTLENVSVQSTTLLNGVALTAVSAAAGLEMLAGSISPGVFSAFVTLATLFLTPLGALIANIEHLQGLTAHLTRLDDVLEARPEPTGPAECAHLRGDIRLDRVRFRYSAASEWVLRGVSLHIHAGEMIAIVGASGSGKSTLARLLPGLLQPVAGRVSFDGIDLRHYVLDSLRRRMGVVLQENELLTASILDNIRLNDPSLTLADVRRAAKLACVDHVIESLPLGYDTVLGDRGVELSGGERQRLCLARAIAHRPAVLVLDEATSALDEATEQRVHANLCALACTRIVVSHRLATVKRADRILVVERGRIVQEGSYASLRVSPGAFRKLAGARELLSA